MEEQLIEFETAKLAKEKGFDIRGYHVYRIDIDDKQIYEHRGVKNGTNKLIVASTQSLLQKWLREVHNIDLWFGELNRPFKYYVEDITLHGVRVTGNFVGSETYEGALEKGLIEALKLIK